MKSYKTITLSILFVSVTACAQKTDVNQLIDAEQNRIDLMDGKADTAIGLANATQNARASAYVFKGIDHVQEHINTSSYSASEKSTYLSALLEYVRGLKRQNLFRV